MVWETKLKACEDFYKKFNSKGAEIEIYIMAKLRYKKSKDFGAYRCIEDDNDR